MGASDCRVLVKVARWRQFAARTSRKTIRFSRGGWAPPGVGHIAMLGDGSAIVAGEFVGKLELGGLKNVSKPCGNFSCDLARAFAAKFGADGVWKWLSNPVGPGGSRISDSEVLADGTTVIVGNVFGEQTFGVHTVSAALEGQGFIAKLTALGTWEWVQILPEGGSFESGRSGGSLDVTADGSLLVRGFFDRSITIAGKTLEYLPNSGNESFVGKISDRGVWAWLATTWGGGSYSSVTATTDGGAVVVGCLEPSSSSRVLGPDTILQPTKRHALFVLKVSNAGKTAWMARMDSDKSTCVGATAPTADGGAVIAGTFESIPFMQSATPTIQSDAACLPPFWKSHYVCFKDWEKYQTSVESRFFVAEISKDGQWSRGVVGGTARFNSIRSLRRFADGTTVISGTQCTTTTFGGTILNEPSLDNGHNTCAGFMAKLTSSFEWSWAFAPANDDFLTIARSRGGVSVLGAGLGVPLSAMPRFASPESNSSSQEKGLRVIVAVVARQD